MINNPAFFVRNAADYVDFQTASPAMAVLPAWLEPFRFRLHELLVARAITGRKTTNPLDICYWSMTPYLFGDNGLQVFRAAGWAALAFNDTAAPDFLHDNLVRHLADRGAAFDFMVQLRAHPDAMPIEDPTIEWSESAAPFIPVARVTLAPQDFDQPTQRAFWRKSLFHPWHGLDAPPSLGRHQPRAPDRVRDRRAAASRAQRSCTPRSPQASNQQQRRRACAAKGGRHGRLVSRGIPQSVRRRR